MRICNNKKLECVVESRNNNATRHELHSHLVVGSIGHKPALATPATLHTPLVDPSNEVKAQFCPAGLSFGSQLFAPSQTRHLAAMPARPQAGAVEVVVPLAHVMAPFALMRVRPLRSLHEPLPSQRASNLPLSPTTPMDAPSHARNPWRSVLPPSGVP